MAGFNNLSIRNKILLQAVAIIALLIVVVAIVYSGITASQDRANWVTHTYQVIGAADDILLNLVNIETGERGFLVTGEEVFLEPYTQGLATYNELQRSTQILVDDNPAQVRLLQAIDANVQEWLEIAVNPAIDVRRQVNSGSAELQAVDDLVSAGQGKQRLDAIRAQLAEFRKVESNLLEERNAEAETAAAVLKGTLVGGAVGAVVIGFVLSFWIASTVARRLGMVSRAATGMAAGRIDDRYELPEGRDEVGQMSAAFGHMADTIRAHLAEQRRADRKSVV